MAFGGFDQAHSGTRPMAEINMIPLIDVMLVLLIIFMITAPLLTHAVKIDLPQAGSQPNTEKPDTVTLSIDAGGKLFWNDAPFEAAELAARLAAEAQKNPQPELHLRAERITPYQQLAEILSAAQSAGIARIGFVTDPRQKE